MNTGAAGPLAGIRVIEIAGIGPLPFATMLLADMGAEVLRIETPRPRELAIHQNDPVLRGRATLTVDLKEPEGRDLLLELVGQADILLEALRPGKMEALGLGPDDCLAIAPWLVFGRVTGWGQSGPLAQTAGHDPNYLGYTGALDWLGGAGRPAMPPLGLVGDTAAGSLYLVIGVLAALTHARESGAGQVVDASILDGTLSLMSGLYSAMDSGLFTNAQWRGMMISGECPFTGIYETSDQRFMVVCPLEPRFYKDFLRVLGVAAETLPDRSDTEAWPTLREHIAQRFRAHNREHWESAFAGTDACASPVLTLEEARAHPANTARAAFVNGQPAPSPRFTQTPSRQAPQSVSCDDLLQRWRTQPPSGGVSSKP